MRVGVGLLMVGNVCYMVLLDVCVFYFFVIVDVLMSLVDGGVLCCKVDDLN